MLLAVPSTLGALITLDRAKSCVARSSLCGGVMRETIFGVVVFVVACGAAPAGTSEDAGMLDAGFEASIDAPTTDAAPPACEPSDAAPTRSFALADWPSFTAKAAPDWTANAGVSSTTTAGGPAGVVIAPGGGHL